ncbi:MAG: hypothetical protein NTX22_10490 [Ignavibacteriales bacterium]|nr:hypothetical protein [Ignavibacteriales bacterium]
MNSRDRVKNIIMRKPAERNGFWLGNPHPDTWNILHKYFWTTNEEELRQKLNDDFRWITPQYLDSTYQHPMGKGIFDIWKRKLAHGELGPLANCISVNEVEDFEWPNLDYLNFDECLSILKNIGDYYRASGFWAPFFHDIIDLFGMENYFLKMYTNPEVVHAVTEKVCTFYLEANKKFYSQAGDLIDAYFFGNDFGTQFDLLLSPEQLEEFIMPWFRKFTNQAHQYGYQVILHSCGSIFKVIEKLIDAGVDCLHPLQAKAKDMNAENLAEHFKDRIAFMGGIDTQDLLVNASPAEVKKEVKRIKELLGPNLIISPSHEALLPNVPPCNVAAMAEAAVEI